jgi:hypothetical protein
MEQSPMNPSGLTIIQDALNHLSLQLALHSYISPEAKQNGLAEILVLVDEEES